MYSQYELGQTSNHIVYVYLVCTQLMGAVDWSELNHNKIIHGICCFPLHGILLLLRYRELQIHVDAVSMAAYTRTEKEHELAGFLRHFRE